MDLDQSIDVTVNNLFDKAFLYAATGLFAITIILTTVQVLVRQLPFLRFISASWTVPVSRFTLILMTYVGGAVVTRNREHISIGLIMDWVGKFYPRIRQVLLTIADVIVIAFLSIALYSAALNASANWTTTVGAVEGITSGHLYLGIGIGLLGMLMYEIQHLVGSIRSLLADRELAAVQEQEEGVEDV